MTGTTLHIPRLETARLVLRAPDARDFDAWAGFYASERSQGVGGPLTRALAWRQLAMEVGHWQLRGYGRWILETRATGETAGMVGLFDPEGWPEPELGWDLFDGHLGRGYATEAATAARAHAYDTLGWTTLISLIKPGNLASMAVARRLGAAHESDITHEAHGPLQIWRHPAPGEAAG